MPEPHEHAEQRGWIESILRRAPGFHGYLEKEYRRDSDQLQRRHLAELLRRAKRKLDRAARPLADAGMVDVLPQFDQVRTALHKQVSRIESAMQGYSGFFDLVRVDEELLDRVYQADLALLDHAELVNSRMDELISADNPSAMLDEVMQLLDAIEKASDARADMLAGLE